MKRLKQALLVAIMLLLSVILQAQDLNINSVSGDDFTFDENSQYLNISLTGLNAPKPDSPKWWDKLLGKKTNYGLAYIEIVESEITKKIPIFTYKKSSGNVYDFDAIGFLDDGIGYPLSRWSVYSENNPPNLTIVVRYWEDKKNAKVVGDIIDAAALLGGMQAAQVEKTLNIGNMVVNLINAIWPDQDKTNSLSISLMKENLNKEFIQIELIDSNGSHVDILKLKLTAKPGRFINKTFQAALNNYSTTELLVWREAIIEADQNLSKTGKGTLVSQLDKFSQYISTLKLTYADKVILIAGAIDSWAQNAVKGVNHDGTFIQFNMSDYRRLRAADWSVLKKYTEYEFAGDNKCNSDACRNMATFLAKSSFGDMKGASAYIANRVLVVQNGNTESIKKDDFVHKFNLYKDSSFTMKKEGVNTWLFSFEGGKLDFALDDKEYVGREVIISFVNVNDSFYVKRIEII